MLKMYDQNLATLRGAGVCEFYDSILQLFCTWLALERCTLTEGLERLDDHLAWLVGWGYPVMAAQIHVDCITAQAAKGE